MVVILCHSYLTFSNIATGDNLGIPIVVSPDDFLDENCDSTTRLMYLSGYWEAEHNGPRLDILEEVLAALDEESSEAFDEARASKKPESIPQPKTNACKTQ